MCSRPGPFVHEQNGIKNKRIARSANLFDLLKINNVDVKTQSSLDIKWTTVFHLNRGISGLATMFSHDVFPSKGCLPFIHILSYDNICHRLIQGVTIITKYNSLCQSYLLCFQHYF